VSPDDYLRAARQWVEMGAQIIGGCCAIGPEYIRLLRENLT
jgi:S-methylmethionine-dependent homocysteine/selenocysteine methylase